ncbi:hypothetical protein D3C85_1158360 [compost metagenome]
MSPLSVVTMSRALIVASAKAWSMDPAYWPTCTEPERAAFFSISPASHEALLRPLSICACNDSRDWLKATVEAITCWLGFSSSASLFHRSGYLRNSSFSHWSSGLSPRWLQESTKEATTAVVFSALLPSPSSSLASRYSTCS